MITHSITSRLILWLSLCSLVVIGSGLYIDYLLSRDEIMERVTLQSKDTINRVVTDLENMLDGVEANTLILGRILEQREYSNAGLEQMLKAVIETNDDLFGAAIALHPDFSDQPRGFAPYFFRRDGLLTTADLTRGDKPYWERAWFTGAAEARAAVWSEPYFDAEGAEVLMTTYSVPVYRTGENGEITLYAVVTADITLDELHDYLQRLRLGESSFAVLLSGLGTVLSSGENSHVMQHYSDLVAPGRERQRWSEMLTATATGQVIDHELSCLDGLGRCVLRLGALESTGWPVGVVYSEAELLAPLRDFQVKSFLVSVMTLLVVALAVFFVSRRLTRPLIALADATDDIARGELNTPLPQHRAQDEVSRLISAFGAMKGDLKTYITDLEQATASRSRLEGELAAAREIQMSMLPEGGEADARIGDLQIWARVSPAKSVGGDFYRYAGTEAGLSLAVGDVSDKGVPAALFMARSMSLLPAEATMDSALDLGMSALNNALTEGNSACMFVTALLASVDADTGELVFASGGHPAPVLLRDGKARELDQTPGPALGLAADQHFPRNSEALLAGDRLVFYTDGVDEAFSAAGEMFGLERFLRQLEESAALDPAAAGDALFNALAGHAGERPQSDDITLVILDFKAGSGSMRFSTALPAGEGLASRGMGWLQSQYEGPHSMEVTLLLEEVLTNIEKYSGLGAQAEVALDLAIAEDHLSLQVSDPGQPFNPLTESGATLGQESDSAEIGGLGVHLIRQLSDEQHYDYRDGQNRLRIVKFTRS